MTARPFSRDSLQLDVHAETARVVEALRHQLSHLLKRRGLVVGLSGGIDSTVTAGLAVRALGPDRVVGLLMPERQSEPESGRLGRQVADWLGIQCHEEDITGILEAVGCYRRYEAAVREVVPEFGPGWVSKLVIGSIARGNQYTTFSVVAQAPDGTRVQKRASLASYLGIVAATNFKQRTRKMLEYYHADRLNYAVAGTPNRLEYDQGFFVKNGDGSADVKPIAHLYKSQVYDLAAHLGAPPEILRRPPTTDTYAMEQSQDEFYFALPYGQLDLCLYAKNHGIDLAAVADVTGLSPTTVADVWKDIDRKRASTRPLHLPPLLVEKIAEISASTEAS